MLIKCPKCRSVFDLPDNAMSPEGLKMRCCECGEIWVGYPKDALRQTKQETKDIQQMFENVSKTTAKIFQEEPKIKVVKVTHVKHTLNWILLAVTLVVLLTTLFAARFDIVRLVPSAEALYQKVGVNSIPHGRDLEFQTVSTREFVDNNIAMLEISGAILNTGKYTTTIPVVKIEISDKDGAPLKDIFHKITAERIKSGEKLLFKVLLPNPTPYKKTIYLTFYDQLSGEKNVAR